MPLSRFALPAALAASLGIGTLGPTAVLAAPASHNTSARGVGAPIAVDTVTLHIEGMTCGGCTLATRKVLEGLDGVHKAEVSYEKKRAVVTFDPARVTVDRMIAAVATLKYTATVVRP